MSLVAMLDTRLSTFPIGNRRIGPGQPVFVIAEAGVNHNGRIELALELVDAAAAAGADAVKFQTFAAARLATPAAVKAGYQRNGDLDSESQLEMLSRLELSEDAHRQLLGRSGERGMLFLSSPFDEGSADLLERLDVPAYKIASGEITNLPLVTHIARKGRPVILSTGMANLEEVGEAVAAIRAAGNPYLALLHCVSAYPADPADANLRAMLTLGASFGLPVGFSDHTPGSTVAIAATALGASVLEKHLTLDRALPGPDHSSSLEPEAFARMVREIRTVSAALGHGRKEPAGCELEIARVARKSLVAAARIPAGTTITRELVAIRRPGTGLGPGDLPRVLGRRALTEIEEGTLLQLELLS